MGSAIEENFPSAPLSALAELESWRKDVNRPVYHMHKWWATRLGSVFRAILIGALSDETTDIWDAFYRPVSFPGAIILDPFMGSGTTLGEALKLGCKVIGSDINPMSVFQVQKAFAAIDVYALQQAFERVRSKVQPEIQRMYLTQDPAAGEEAQILYSFWVMAVHCPHCLESVRLFDTSIFARHAYPQRVPTTQSLCFACGAVNSVSYNTTHTECTECGRQYNPQVGIASGAKATCTACHEEFRIAEAVSASQHAPEYALYALLIVTKAGEKKYVRASAADRALYQEASALLRQRERLIPDSDIAPGHNTDQILRYNFHQWRQLFNDRQLYCLSLLLDAIVQEPDIACRELLLLLFSSILEYNNMLCSYKGEGTGAVRPLFSHHILKPERMALENTVWGLADGSVKSSGCFANFFESRILRAMSYRQQPFELRVAKHGQQTIGSKVFHLSQPLTTTLASDYDSLQAGNGRALVFCGDSAHLDLPDHSVDLVVTDPPYFDFVHYSELADFFFVWLRLALQATRPEFRVTTTRRAEETQQHQASAFSIALARTLRECHRTLKPGGLLIFSFHHSRNEGWEAVGQALIAAGFGVVSAHPIKAEMAGATPKSQSREPINFDAILVCKERSAPIHSTLADALNATQQAMQVKLDTLAGGVESITLSSADRFVIAQSQALCVFSRHVGLMADAQGNIVSLAAFLAETEEISERLAICSDEGRKKKTARQMTQTPTTIDLWTSAQ